MSNQPPNKDTTISYQPPVLKLHYHLNKNIQIWRPYNFEQKNIYELIIHTLISHFVNIIFL